MNPQDVFRDINNAFVEHRQVRIRRSARNGRICWIIEIDNAPLSNQFNTRMREVLERFGIQSDQSEEERTSDEWGNRLE